MKKITLLIALFFVFTANIYAQFPESFEGATFPPTGWAKFRGTNGLGTAQDWTTSTLAENISSGTKGAFVRWEAVTAGQLAEDWLVTPQFTVTAPNVLLSFFDRNQYTTDFGTQYTIRVSTTSQTNIASFTTINTKSETDLSLTMTQRSVNLSAYVGQSIYVAFVMTQNDGDNWAIDNVSLQPSVSLPDCATLVAPADASVVPVGNITFSWTAATTSDPATSYDLYYGLTASTVTNLFGNFTTTTASAILNNYDTTFYWKIVPKNLAGSQTNCPVWSFTTQSPPGFCLSAPTGQYPSTDFTPSVCNGQTSEEIVADGYAGEYSNVNVTLGQTYVFSSSVDTDFITISADGGLTAAAYGVTPLTWVSTVDGVVRFYTHTDDQCGAETVGRSRSVTCGVPTCVPPVVVFDKLSDCPAATFSVTADITDMGSASSITVSDNQGSATQQSSFPGLVTFGPYSSGTAVVLTVVNDDDNSCTIVSSDITDYCPPLNDDCSGATTLTLGTIFDDNAIISSNVGATDSSVGNPTCSTYLGGDVWFKAVVPASGSITFETATDDDSVTDTAIQAFTGDCASLTAFDCNDDIDLFGGNYFSILELTGLAEGETVYLRLFSYKNLEIGTFKVSAYDASLANESFDSSNFSYFPNPVKNVLNLTNSKNIDKVQIINILGQEVIAKSLNNTQSQIDMSSLPSGSYLVKVTSDNQVKTIKVIKE